MCILGHRQAHARPIIFALAYPCRDSWRTFRHELFPASSALLSTKLKQSFLQKRCTRIEGDPVALR